MPNHGPLLPSYYCLPNSFKLKCMAHARSLLSQTPSTVDSCQWLHLLRTLSRSGSYPECILSYVRMLRCRAAPTKYAYPLLVHSCSGMFALDVGEQVHSHVLKFGFGSDVYVNNSLIDMYGKCSRADAARWVFDDMHEKDDVSWNSMISAYVLCGEVGSAHEVFDGMPMRRNVVCWTSLINGYGRQGGICEMVRLFLRMLLSDDYAAPNATTMVCLLSACSRLSRFEVGRWILVFMEVNRIPSNVFLVTAVMDMYTRFGNVVKARRLFDKLSNKTLVSWNAMITGYVHCGFPEEAIKLFSHMKANQVEPNEITMVNLLSCCASLGALEFGEELHCYISRSRLELNVIVAAALVDMYSKCGSIDNACLVFVKQKKRDTVLWNAMVTGLAIHGRGGEALSIFAEMERDGVRPNESTFVGVLSACMHSGLIDKGREYFETMQNRYGLIPELEHYACMVDLLGRAGRLVEAAKMVRTMPMEPDIIIWGALLGACRIHKNVELAQEVGNIILTHEVPNLGCCVLLSNIYAAADKWAEVAKVRSVMKQSKIKKPSGFSWIEVNGGVHKFTVEDTLHLQLEEIHVIQGLLNYELGHTSSGSI